MQQLNDILSLANRNPLITHELELVYELEKQIPGSVQYGIYRYKLQPHITPEDTAVLLYNYEAKQPKDKNIELRFCLNGNKYCNSKSCSNGVCKKTSQECEADPTVDVFLFRFTPSYLSPFTKGRNIVTKSDRMLAFKEKQSFTTTVNLCSKIKTVLENLMQHNYSNALENIYVNSQLQSLLLYGLECLTDQKAEESFVCRFLATDTAQETILQAREILLQRIGEPITIKELSRKVGTNECYLKKGFKEMFGTTIFEFYQNQRMEHAKYLLYEKGLSVTEVSAMLGYSSISHFSTAFKKHTGLKPCELLFR
ncbi:MAG: helix-turn-helix transcriptional regulator [Chitinophagaceae bacterium]|nr:helix-turn-helix transcriptional regulator [Chitinophagaceae bacterium]